MVVKRDQAVELNYALSQKGLKTKHISGDNFIRLLNIKTILKNSINALSESEQELAEEFGAIQNEYGFFIEDKDKQKEFSKNLRDKQKAYSIELELNFVPESELKEYCKEQDTSVEAVLFEYLLKK
jgi:hypothetical protein